MRDHFFLSTVVLTTLIAIMLQPAGSSSQWAEDGIPICSAREDQSLPDLVSDGAGGVIFTWTDIRSDTSDIYVQRVDVSGMPSWDIDGVAISSALGHQSYSRLVSDGGGGAIIAWLDLCTPWGDIYAQRVDASGTSLWNANGEAVCTTMSYKTYPRLVSDGVGGAIIVWEGGGDIYGQRVDASGALRWDADGLPICTETGNQLYPELVPDGSGGAIIVWEDHRGDDRDVYAQRVEASGLVMWGVNGVAVCTEVGSQHSPQLVSDGAGGSIVAWMDNRSGDLDIFAQRMNASGNIRWGLGGLPICTETGGQLYAELASDAAGGAVIAWQDLRAGNDDVYAQRVSFSGVVLWEPDGMAICTTADEQSAPQLVSDGVGGALIVWFDNRAGNDDIYAQRVDAEGDTAWPKDGLAICTATGDQAYPRLLADGGGGGVIVWEDNRGDDWDIFAHRVDHKGEIPRPFVRGDVDADGNHDIFDGLLILYWIGGHAPAPLCVNTADVEDDEDVDLYDGLRILYWVGGGAPAPPIPCCDIPGSCNLDPSPGWLTCNSYPPCESGKRSNMVVDVGRREDSHMMVGQAEISEDGRMIVPVGLTNAEPLIGFSVVLQYDPSQLIAAYADNTGLVTEGFDFFFGGVTEPGLVRVVAVSDVDIGDGVGRLPAGEHQVARISFEFRGNLHRDVVLDLTEGVMAISYDRSLSHRLVDGAIESTADLAQDFFNAHR